MLFLGKIYYMINLSERRLITDSIEYVFKGKKSRAEIKMITKNVFRGILAHYYEKIHNAYKDINELNVFFQKNIEAPGLNKLDDALKKGKGVMLVTAHYGAVEYIPLFLALKGYPISVIAKFSAEQLERSILFKAKNVNAKIIIPKEGKNILIDIIKELKAGRIVFTECDEIEEWKPSTNRRIWFMKKLVGVDRTINIIKRRTGAEVVFGVIHRFGLSRYKFILKNRQDMLHHLGTSVIASIGEMILKCLEEYIYASPEGWYQWKDFAKLERSDIYKEVNKRKSGFPSLQPT
jgi:lauroyl/myristoyl acyltransferase